MNAYKVTYIVLNDNLPGGKAKVNRGSLTVVAASADAASSAVLDMYADLGVLAAITEVEALAAGELF